MNFLSALLDAVAQAAGPWAAGRLKLRSNELGGAKNAAAVAKINAITQPVVTAVVSAEAAKLDAQGQKAVAGDATTSEVGALLGDAFGETPASN